MKGSTYVQVLPIHGIGLLRAARIIYVIDSLVCIIYPADRNAAQGIITVRTQGFPISIGVTLYTKA